jgi:predicted O-methyltransferase YrrM
VSVIVNVMRNAMRRGYGREMLRKVLVRYKERDSAAGNAQSVDWCRKQQIDAGAWCRSIDPGLWDDAERFAIEQDQIASRLADERGRRIGGGGFYALLYFLTRLLRPQIIVETGVAFGFSSRAFLKALKTNGSGELFSSDFPYFRQTEPEGLIGLLVEPELRARWNLLVGSDRDNLPTITSSVTQIDLLHYDSDKSRSGREFALAALEARLAPEALVVFDDIQDNTHFRDWMVSTAAPHLVFEFKGKWIGLTGGPPLLYPDGHKRRAPAAHSRRHN